MPVTGIDNWEYARWTTVVGRSIRINPPAAGSAETLACGAFITYEFGKRPWLKDEFYGNSEQLQGLVTQDNPQAVGKNIEVVGRDILRIQVQDIAEKNAIDALLTATKNRRFGGGPEYGGGIGSDVDQTP